MINQISSDAEAEGVSWRICLFTLLWSITKILEDVSYALHLPTAQQDSFIDTENY